MQDEPTPATIRELANAQLAAIAPADTSARAKFERRVAEAALELVQRAETLSPTSDAAERLRLTALLGETGDLNALNVLLCERIRAGALTLASPGVAAHLRAATLEKLAVDQPSYAAYRRALETHKG